MKNISLFLILAFCLTVIGCGIHGPVEEVKAFITEKDDVTLQMSKKIEASPNEAGVDEARKVFEARKESLKAKKDAIYKKSEGFNADWKTMLMDSVVNDNKYFNAMRTKVVTNDAADKKFLALEKDFQAVVR